MAVNRTQSRPPVRRATRTVVPLEEQLRRLPPKQLAELEEALAAVRGGRATGPSDDDWLAAFEQGLAEGEHETDLLRDDLEQEVDAAWHEGYAEGVREGARLAGDLKDAERTAAYIEEQVREAQERVSDLVTQLAEVEAREKDLALREQGKRSGPPRQPQSPPDRTRGTRREPKVD